MPVRKKIPDKTIDEVLVACGRRCCLCFGLDADTDQKEGQVAHVDRDSSNNNADNLAWLCLTHHAGYDSRSRMTKAVTPGELRRYRDRLHAAVAASEIYTLRLATQPTIASTASGNASVVNAVGNTVNVRGPRGKRPPTIAPPPGTIGHDALMLSYSEYLVKRYNEWRKSDGIPGRSHGRLTTASSAGTLRAHSARVLRWSRLTASKTSLPTSRTGSTVRCSVREAAIGTTTPSRSTSRRAEAVDPSGRTNPTASSAIRRTIIPRDCTPRPVGPDARWAVQTIEL